MVAPKHRDRDLPGGKAGCVGGTECRPGGSELLGGNE